MTGNEDLSVALASTDAAQVATAIEALHHRLLTADTIPVSLPPDPISLLAGDQDDLLVKYLRVLRSYPFDPSPSDQLRLATAIDVVLSAGGSYAARQLSLQLVIEGTVAAALHRVAERGVGSDREADQAGWLLSYLLDDDETRFATVGALRCWLERPELRGIVEGELPRLTTEEQRQLRAS